jgi:hypothetical protein
MGLLRHLTTNQHVSSGRQHEAAPRRLKSAGLEADTTATRRIADKVFTTASAAYRHQESQKR